MIAFSAMPDLEHLVEVALGSELFSAPHLEADLDPVHGRRRRPDARARGPLPRGRDAADLLRRQRRLVGEHVVGKAPVRPVRAGTGRRLAVVRPDLAGPRRLGPDAVVFVASYSGQTEDTLAALRFARGTRRTHRGARRQARHADRVRGRRGARLLALRGSTACRSPRSPRSSCEWGRLEGDQAAAGVLDALAGIPAQVGEAFTSTRARGRELALELASSELIYCLAAGPLYGLAYKFGLTVFMENMRVHSSVIDSTEFRHGPAEMLDRHSPDMIFLLGRDASRTISERSARVASEHGARVRVFDADDHPDVHPLLQPFVLKVALQWFIVYSTLARGISDLDDRALMGHQVLSRSGLAVKPVATMGDNCFDHYLPPLDRRVRGRERAERRRRAARPRPRRRLRGGGRRRRRRPGRPRRGQGARHRHDPRPGGRRVQPASRRSA